jgi:hypothetical protein
LCKFEDVPLFSEFTKPPYVVRESGYGNFEINVDIYFKGIKDKDPARRTQMQYSLFLSPSLEALSSGNKDKLKRENTYTQRRLVTLSHKDPSVIKRLIKGKQTVRHSFEKI